MKLVISKDGASREFSLTKRPIGRIPSRRKTVVTLPVGGTPTEVPYTVNSGWCDKPEYALTRLWFVLETPADGEKPASRDAYFAILDYAETAESLAGSEAEIVDGTAERKDPDRVPRSEEMVTKRRETLATTLAAKKNGEAPTETVEGETPPVAETPAETVEAPKPKRGKKFEANA